MAKTTIIVSVLELHKRLIARGAQKQEGVGYSTVNGLRRRKYDLALDASCSSAALDSFIVGFSGAQFSVGIRPMV